jgi:hypothetical protein
MTNFVVVCANELDVSRVTLSDPKKSVYNSKVSYIQYDGKKMYIEVPKMYLPNGVTIFTDESSGKNSYHLEPSGKFIEDTSDGKNPEEASVLNNVRRQKIEETIKRLEALDRRLVELAYNNGGFFAKKYSSVEDLLNKEKYTAIIRPPFERDGVVYPKKLPLCRMMLTEDNKFRDLEVVDRFARPIRVTPENVQEIFPKSCQASIILDATCVRIMKDDKFKLNLNVCQVAVFNQARKLTKLAFNSSLFNTSETPEEQSHRDTNEPESDCDDDDNASVSTEGDAEVEPEQETPTQLEEELTRATENISIEPKPKRGRGRKAE